MVNNKKCLSNTTNRIHIEYQSKIWIHDAIDAKDTNVFNPIRPDDSSQQTK